MMHGFVVSRIMRDHHAGAKRLAASLLSVIFAIISTHAADVDDVDAYLLRSCGRDANGTVVEEMHQYPFSYCEDPSPFDISTRDYNAGTVFTGFAQFGPRHGHVSYFQVGALGIKYACDGVLLVETMSRNMRPRERPHAGALEYGAARDIQDGRSQWGNFGFPITLGMRCLVEPLDVHPSINSTSIHHLRHGRVYDCTICDEDAPFDCPTEFDRWLLDVELTYRDGNICDAKFGTDRENSTWFGFMEQYYQPNMAVWFAFNGRVAELGPTHPFMPGHHCPDDDLGSCPCSLPTDSPVYPDSLYGGENPTFSLPVVLRGFPSASRRLGQRLSGCNGAAIVQAAFKLTEDDSWDLDPTVEFRGVNETRSMGLNRLRNDVLTPSLYVPGRKDGQPPIPKMSGLLNPGLLRYRDDNVTLIRCVIEPSMDADTKAEQYVHGTPTKCVSCVHGSRTESLCVAPSMTNGSSAWILDTVTGFNPAAFVPGIAVPPGFSVTLAAYNATADTEALRASLPSNVLPARSYPTDDPTWVSFSYRHHGPVEG